MMKRIGILLCCLGLLAIRAQAQQAGVAPVVSIQQQVSTQQADSLVKVSAVDNRIIVSNVPVKSKLEIYNIVGSKVKEIDMKQPSGEYPVTLPKGYYIVRIEGIVRKIVIR
jgi:hypothetical protein